MNLRTYKIEASEKEVSTRLHEFVTESNLIENIYDAKRHKTHRVALELFLSLDAVQVSDLERFVKSVEPLAFLRTATEHRVWIGGHESPPPRETLPLLYQLLKKANNGAIDPWQAHVEYESLHPFIDGNGRSGRALWLWMMKKKFNYDLRYGFLRMFYYQTLSNSQAVLKHPAQE